MSAPVALRLESLRALSFRNLTKLELNPGPKFNVLHGDNGAGKSNVLELVHYLATLKSFRGAKADDLVELGEPTAMLDTRITGSVVPRRFQVALHRNKARQLKLDGKRPPSIARWQASIQMVLFHPGHLSIAMGGPDQRRAFIDRIIEQMDPTYSAALSRYQKAIRSRNRLLKQDGVDLRAIRAFHELLASAGQVIGQTRARLIDDLAPEVERAFASVTDEALPLEVRYAPRVRPTVQAILEALDRSFAKDRARGFTAEGPHGDDLSLNIPNRAAARYHASQGQHRALVLALKIAELRVLAARTGRVPILLLDDVSSELDRTRNKRLFDVLRELGGQVFMTTTHPEFILIDQDRVDWEVCAGQVASTKH